MEDRLQKIVELSFGSSPEDMLKASLEACIELAGAQGGSILGEEGPSLQFLFSDVPELIGTSVPFDSIAGASVEKSTVIYTFAPMDNRHYDGIDEKLKQKTRYLLSLPIPSIHRQGAADHAARNAGAMQLLFSENVFGGTGQVQDRIEADARTFQASKGLDVRLQAVFRLLPIVAFAMEVMKLRHTSYQVIHELKNKLIGGQSWVDYLKEDIERKSPGITKDESIAQDFELAENAMKEGAELAKTYLQFTKLYSPNFAQVDIGEVLAETAASVKALAAQLKVPGLKITLDMPDARPARSLDATQLKMAFFNLCKNGVEALAQHKTVDPSIRIVCKVCERDRIRIDFRDNGPGMPPEISQNLFAAFKTKKEGGTGLGLTITKKIVDVHGGTVTCETGKNGTCFTVTV